MNNGPSKRKLLAADSQQPSKKLRLSYDSYPETLEPSPSNVCNNPFGLDDSDIENESYTTNSTVYRENLPQIYTAGTPQQYQINCSADDPFFDSYLELNDLFTNESYQAELQSMVLDDLLTQVNNGYFDDFRSYVLNEFVTVLNLSDGKIVLKDGSKVNLGNLCEALKGTNITTLLLQNNKVNDNELLILLAALKDTNVSAIDISGNQISLNAMNLLACSIHSIPLREVYSDFQHEVLQKALRKKQLRAMREAWFRDDLGLAEINANRGIINCAHCALRFNDYLRDGHTNGIVTPVPTTDANLFIVKKHAENSLNILYAYTEDERIISRCTTNRSSTPQRQEGNESENQLLSSLINQPNQNDGNTSDIKQLQLHKFDTQSENLAEKLKTLVRRRKDESCYGFISLTCKENFGGHIINYFVDSPANDSEVYFIDTQPESGKVTESIDMSKFLAEVVIIPAMPPEGIRVDYNNYQSMLLELEELKGKLQNSRKLLAEKDIQINLLSEIVATNNKNAQPNIVYNNAFTPQSNLYRVAPAPNPSPFPLTLRVPPNVPIHYQHTPTIPAPAYRF